MKFKIWAAVVLPSILKSPQELKLQIPPAFCEKLLQLVCKHRHWTSHKDCFQADSIFEDCSLAGYLVNTLRNLATMRGLGTTYLEIRAWCKQCTRACRGYWISDVTIILSTVNWWRKLCLFNQWNCSNSEEILQWPMLRLNNVKFQAPIWTLIYCGL